MSNPFPSRFKRGWSWIRVALVILVWTGAAAVVLVTAADTKVGPVLIKLSRGHGIHLGDALVFVVVTATASAVTWLLLRRRATTWGAGM